MTGEVTREERGYPPPEMMLEEPMDCSAARDRVGNRHEAVDYDYD